MIETSKKGTSRKLAGLFENGFLGKIPIRG
jgi:hypothetical protein